MVDIQKEDLVFAQGAGLALGGPNPSDCTKLSRIFFGTVTLDFPSCAAGAVVSASGAFAGVDSTFNVLLGAQSWVLNNSVIVEAAAGIAGGIQATATNPSAGAIDAASTVFNFIAFK